MGEVVDLAEERLKRQNPEFYKARKAEEAIIRQQLSLPKPVEVIEPEWDDEAGCEVITYHLNRDPGDECP